MSGKAHHGAFPGEWDHWVALGLAEDLLPVVSAPGFAISDDSRMKSIGKTPSRFSARGAIAGFKDWTTTYVTEKQIAAWRKDDRLGICIQTRRVKALDIDVNDPALVEEILGEVYRMTGHILPMRGRANSGKALLLFRCSAYLGKRTVKWIGDNKSLIEFLANGQQFIAAGAHWSSVPNEPSGAHYAWEGGLPASIPALTEEQALAVWASIIEKFGVPGSATGGGDRERRKGEVLDTTDRVALFLEEKGLVLEQGDGKLFIDCPWKLGHSGDSGVTETSWMLGGTNQYEQGHFNCQHASCKKYTRDDFLAEIGYIPPFTPLDDEEAGDGGEEGEADPEAAAVRERNVAKAKLITTRDGRYVANIHNLEIVVGASAFSGWQFRYDQALDRVTITNRESVTRPVDDFDRIKLRGLLEGKGFSPIGREAMRDAIDSVARANIYDSYIERARSLVWDGVPRVERFLTDYLGVPDSPYARAVSLYWWTAQAGRLLEPGIQADMVPVMLGDQGIGKSDILQVLANGLIAGTYKQINLADRDDDTARLLRGALLGELDELRGLRTREAEGIKAWITRRFENWVPKFREDATTYPRRCIFVGTTNNRQFLDDPTGERRWLPFEAVAIDRVAAARDCEQLWAEGVALFDMVGIAWAEAQRLAALVHGDFKIMDAWEEALREWLGEHPEVEMTTPRHVAVQVFGINTKDIAGGVEMRIGKILQNCGFLRKQTRVGTGREWRYVRCHHLSPVANG